MIDLSTKIIILCFFLLGMFAAPAFPEDAKTPPKDSGEFYESLNITKIKQEYVTWKVKNNLNKESGTLRVEILSSSESKFKGISTVFRFYRLKLIEQGQGWHGEYFRLLATGEDTPGNQLTFFDSGFFQPECGADHEMSFGQISSIQIKKKPIIIVDNIIQPISCMDIPSQETVKSTFFTAASPYSKVFEIERSYVNYHNPEDGKIKPVEYRSAYFQPNGCIGADCSFLTVWYAKPALAVQSFRWDAKMTQLIQTK